MSMAIYKIWHPESNDIFAEYIETDMGLNQVADLAAGLQFFIEEECEYGSESTVDERAVALFLCAFFGCKPGTADAWASVARMEYKARINMCAEGEQAARTTETINDIIYGTSIDLFKEREWRCGPACETYIGLIKPFQNTDFMKALMKHHDSKSCLFTQFEPPT